MIPCNLAHDYVRDIPWENHPAFAFSNDAERYLIAFSRAVDKTPDDQYTVHFQDDIWDFNPYFDGINNASYKIVFTDLPSPVREYCKFFVLYSIMGKKKISTADLRVSGFKSIFLAIISKSAHNTLSLITTDDIIEEISSRNISDSGMHSLYVDAFQCYSFFISNYHLDLPVDLNKLEELARGHKASEKAQDLKLPNIPEEYFSAILYEAIKAMRNQEEPYNTRCTACEIVMLSQLGLRIGDLLALQTNQLFTKKLAKTGNEVSYIHYKSRKPSKPHDALLEFDIFANSLCVEAFNILKELRMKNPLSEGNNYLYILEAHFNSTNTLPIAKTRFNNEFKRFLLNKLPELSSKEWDGIKMSVYNTGSKKRIKLVALPDTRQFRVHICTALYEHGIPLAYIQKYMGHLSEYMLGYYVRPKDTYQENVKYTEKIIKEIVEDDINPLGGSFGSDIKKSIQQFVKDNNFNVQNDIEAIVKAMGDRVIIRGKTGGVCIKTSLMPCAKDARTNEMFCAYNLCPNLFTFYYMADISYLDFQTLQQTIAVLTESGKTKAASKEKNKLIDLCKRRLIPELDELDKELARKGEDIICIKYPSLADIILRRAEIREEIKTWMN